MNDLLTWISFKHSGSLAMLRHRADNIYKEARWNLSKLGHVEFGNAAKPHEWRVTRPVLAMSATCSTHEAIVCGARLPRLLDRLRNVFGDKNVDEELQEAAPDCIRVHANTYQEIECGATQAGYVFQKDAPLSILAALKSVKSAKFEEIGLPVGSGWSVQRFSRSKMGWVDIDVRKVQSQRNGLFLFQGDYPPRRCFLREAGVSFSCSPRIGIFKTLERKNRACFINKHGDTLIFPRACRPPELIERALVLCSGKIPEIMDGFITYRSVSRGIASVVAALLGQNLNQWNQDD